MCLIRIKTKKYARIDNSIWVIGFIDGVYVFITYTKPPAKASEIIESLIDKSHKPLSKHPKAHTDDELNKIKNLIKRNV